jgi:hypothetical protein
MEEATQRFGFKSAIHTRADYDVLAQQPAEQVLPAVGLFANGKSYDVALI